VRERTKPLHYQREREREREGPEMKGKMVEREDRWEIFI
jgi:hypothetical protein